MAGILDPRKKQPAAMSAMSNSSTGTAQARPNIIGGVAQGNAQTYNAAQGTAETYKPVERDVQGNELVENRLNGILDQNSAYIQRARAAANSGMNARGLFSSSMAAGAAEGAAIDRAMPIASQDANTYAQRASQNLGAVNDAGQFNAGAKNNMTMNNVNNQNQASQFNAGSVNQMTLSNQDAYNQDRALGRQIGSQEKMQTQQLSVQQSMQSQQLKVQERMSNQGIYSQERMQNHALQSQERQAKLGRDQESAMRNLDEIGRVGMIRLEQEYAQVAQKSEVISRNYAQSIDSLAQIGSNNSLTPDQQRAGSQMIQNQMSQFQGFANALYNQQDPVYRRG